MKKFLGILVLGLMLCNTGFSVESLIEGQKGTIKFKSIPVITLNQFLNKETEGKPVKISGKLQFPTKKWTGRLPAIVLLHGGGGVNSNQINWAKDFRKIGLATFIVDSNSARGCRSRKGAVVMCKNNYLHQGMAHIVDAYRALELLSTHPRIDSTRVAVIGFSVGARAALYSSVKRFKKMWGTPGLEFAAHIPLYPSCRTIFDKDELVSDHPIRIFYGSLDEFSSPEFCEEYVNRLRKAGKDVTITIYPGVHHGFDRKPDSRSSGKPRLSSTTPEWCRFVEDVDSDHLVFSIKDKDNKELETLNTQCLSLYPNRKQVCRIVSYSLLKTSNIYYGSDMVDWFSNTIKMKEKMCKMETEGTTVSEEVAAKEEAKPTLEKVKATLSESDKKFAESVEKFIKKEWGESDWEMGFVQCMIGHAASLSKEVKEVVIEYGPEKAFEKISNQEDELAYSKLFQACEKGAEVALKAEKSSQSQSSQSSTISSESFSEAELASYMSKLEKYLVETAEYQKKAMAGFMSDSSCKIESKHTVKYNKEAATKARKAVADFLIDTFEITSPL